MVAKVGKWDALLQLQSIEAVGVDFVERPSSGGGGSSHCVLMKCRFIVKRVVNDEMDVLLACCYREVFSETTRPSYLYTI
jgi:hypothetical protein